MKTIAIKTLPFYIIKHNECFELIDSLLKSIESIDDEKMMKEKNILDKCIKYLEAEEYRMGFSYATLKCFERQTLISLSIEYRTAKRLALLGQHNDENLANWCNNKVAAKHSL
nr:MAG TPA: hypothetical protein [Caudoviricetes sp.]